MKLDGGWLFISSIFIGGCILAAADKGFGIFLMLISGVIVFLAVTNG
jgi:hypothetical protein